MATVSLKISVVDSSMVKTLMFDPTTTIYDACRMIRDRLAEPINNLAEYGLYFADDDQKKGIWLENNRNLEYYLLRTGDMLEFKKKQRVIKVRMLDESVKSLVIDDSHIVEQLMVTICLKIGITNHEEYSLVRELSDEDRMRTLTMKRDRSIAKDQKKLEEMKRKLHTDDELEWLDHSKTLREQGIDPSETLLLRRKYFFSDQNVDARDPIQLNLLYVQMRDAILKGAHPVNQEEAIKFAAYQCQIQFGDHVDSKHKSGFLDLKDFLPKEYCKLKGIEKKIFQEHKACVGMSEVEARYKYTHMARSLKTYGITFFLVKEKVKGKNKLVPRLLGITKKSIVRVDENTKEILKVWDLTTVRRWAASPNSFTLDFGDYAEAYYAVQTTEGEQIAQLISGYIDIILKKQEAKDYMGIDADDESTMYEDSVAPSKATIMQMQGSTLGQVDSGSVALPAVLRAGETGPAQFSRGNVQPAKFSHTSHQAHTGHMPSTGRNAQLRSTLGQAQRALLGNISDALAAMSAAQNAFDHPKTPPQLGSDPASLKWIDNVRDVSRQKLNAELSAMSAATAQLVTLTAAGPDNMDYIAVNSAIQAICANMDMFSQDVCALASVDGNKRNALMDAARQLTGAFTDLLNVAQPGSDEPRQSLLNAAARVGEVSQDFIVCIESESDLDRDFKERLVAMAKAVANATGAMVKAAKDVSDTCEGKAEQNRVVDSARHCGLATSQLVACTKVLAPTIASSPECQEQFGEAVKQVASFVDDVIETAEDVCNNEAALGRLREAALLVARSLDDLMNHIRRGTTATYEGTQMEDVKSILVASERLFGASDPSEMMRQTQAVTESTAQLINALKMEAQSTSDAESRSRLLNAAKLLADATTKMVEVAKGCAGKPDGEAAEQEAMKQAAEDLRIATNIAASSCVVRKQTLGNLQQACKRAASAATQLINSSAVAAKSNSNVASQSQLSAQTHVISDETIPRIVQALRAATLLSPNDDPTHAELALVSAAHEMIQNGGQMVDAVHAVLPTVADQSAALGLSNCSRAMSAALAELCAAIAMVQDISPAHAPQQTAINAALAQVQALNDDLAQIRQSLAAKKLVPLPGDKMEKCTAELGATSKLIGSSMAQMLTAAAQGNCEDTGSAAQSTADGLKQLVALSRGIAATMPAGSSISPNDILDAAGDILDKSANLIAAAKTAVDDPENPNSKAQLTQVAKAASASLNNCVNCLPGLREVDQIVKHVSTVSVKLTTTTQKLPPVKCSIIEARSHLGERAAELNKAAAEIVSAATSTSTQQIAPASHRFSRAYEDFVETGLEAASAAAASGDAGTQSEVVSGLRGVSTVASRLLVATKALLVNPAASNARNQLTAAARAVTESINQLITVCAVSAAPGLKECDGAVRQIQTVRPMLDNPNLPVGDGTYFDCLENVTERAKLLADSMTGISTAAKQGAAASPAFCMSVARLAEAVCGITENAAQAAYLVGTADVRSVPGRPGLLDADVIVQAAETIQYECQTFTDPSCNQMQMLTALSLIAKQTALICNTCRTASEKSQNASTKRNFVQLAKDIASGTAAVVQAVKMMEGNLSDDNRQRCAKAAKPLLQAVETLTTFAVSPEFASMPATISAKGQLLQQPVTSAARDVIDSAVGMVETAKHLTANPQDPATHHSYSALSHKLSENIKDLLTAIRQSAPGQSECETALENIDSWIHHLDQASLAAVAQSLTPQHDGSLAGFQEQVIASARQLQQQIEPLRHAAKGATGNLERYVVAAAGYLEPLTCATVGWASRAVNSKLQMTLLDQSKTVVECMQNLLVAAKDAGGSGKAVHLFAAVDETADGANETLQEFIDTLQNAAASSGLVTSLVHNLTQAVSRVAAGDSQPPSRQAAPGEAPSYVDCQTNIMRLTKQVAQIVQEMMSTSVTSVQELGTLANNLTHSYNDLATESCRIALACPTPQVGSRIKSSVQQLGTGCIELVQDAGSLQLNPNAGIARRDLGVHARKVLENISEVVLTIQTGSRGTQACINAAGTIDGVIADLETTVMFAAAGTLNPEPGETFANHRDSVLKTAKDLVDNAKALVAGAASNQEHLMSAANTITETIARMADCVKLGAASLGSHQPDAQVMLINSAKDVASALSHLINSAKNASGKQGSDQATGMLKESAKVVVTNVTSLLKTVKTVEDEAARGTQALESSIEAISQEMKSLQSNERSEQRITPDELVRLTRPVTLATAKAVAAGNSGHQDDIIAAANMGRKAVSDLLRGCRSSVVDVTDRSLLNQVSESGAQCASSYRDLLQQIHLIATNPSVEAKRHLVVVSKCVASAVAELVQSIDAIRGTDWVDPLDPTVIAENELLSAANSIEAAAKKLAQLQPRLRPRQADESLNFEEQILEAAKSIATATGALVKAASVAQRELVEQGKIGVIKENIAEDNQWSEGLVSAARLVAVATHSLCDAANAMVQGQASEEKLISSSKQVAASTAQLLLACKVKANPNSKAMQRLQNAGNAVKRATEALVHEAQSRTRDAQAGDDVDDAVGSTSVTVSVSGSRMVSGMAQVIMAQEDILRKERELEEARQKLKHIRLAQYQGHSPGVESPRTPPIRGSTSEL